jgi:hypothetical protein
VTSRRANGAGSIFPYRNGFAAYVWITTPSGKRQRQYVYGRSREIVHSRWVELTGRPRTGRSSPRCRQLGSSSIDGSKRDGCSESRPAYLRDLREPREELHRARNRCHAA